MGMVKDVRRHAGADCHMSILTVHDAGAGRGGVSHERLGARLEADKLTMAVADENTAHRKDQRMGPTEMEGCKTKGERRTLHYLKETPTPA